MRLFGKVNSLIDRFDRAEWMTLPFDLSLRVNEPATIKHGVSLASGISKSDASAAIVSQINSSSGGITIKDT